MRVASGSCRVAGTPIRFWTRSPGGGRRAGQMRAVEQLPPLEFKLSHASHLKTSRAQQYTSLSNIAEPEHRAHKFAPHVLKSAPSSWLARGVEDTLRQDSPDQLFCGSGSAFVWPLPQASRAARYAGRHCIAPRSRLPQFTPPVLAPYRAQRLSHPSAASLCAEASSPTECREYPSSAPAPPTPSGNDAWRGFAQGI